MSDSMNDFDDRIIGTPPQLVMMSLALNTVEALQVEVTKSERKERKLNHQDRFFYFFYYIL